MTKVARLDKNGFTLLELLTVVAIMGITLAFGLPSMQGVIISNRLTTSANDMLGALQSARSEAIKRVKGCGVSINNNSWFTYCGDSSVTANRLQTYSAAKGISLTFSGTSDNTADSPEFMPDGKMQTSQTTDIDMIFSATGTVETRTLKLRPSGKMSITKSP